MTYDEYRSSKDNKPKKNYIKIFLSKLFTIIIFTMTIVIISNLSSNFRNFIINNVLDSTFDFSILNKVINKTTNVFKSDKLMEVASEIEKDEDWELPKNDEFNGKMFNYLGDGLYGAFSSKFHRNFYH